MKRIWFTLAIACLAITGTARADVWGRVIPNSLISRTQDKEQDSAVQQPNVQAPIAAEDLKGYPFADRCGGCNSGCCARVWDGYSSSCGCGFSRGQLGHHGGKHCGCGRLHAHGCGAKSCNAGGCSSCGGCGGCANSFGGGACYSDRGCGGTRGLGWHAFGLQAFGGCGCGKQHHFHHLHGLWRACGLGCNTGCDSNGCDSCNGHSDKNDGTVKHIMNPPEVPNEPTPVVEQGPVGVPVPADEKSAFRSWNPTTTRRFPASF